MPFYHPRRVLDATQPGAATKKARGNMLILEMRVSEFILEVAEEPLLREDWLKLVGVDLDQPVDRIDYGECEFFKTLHTLRGERAQILHRVGSDGRAAQSVRLPPTSKPCTMSSAWRRKPPSMSSAPMASSS